MLALYRAGRQADALATYRRLQHALRDELGIDLGQPIRDLHAAVLRQDAALGAAPPARLAPAQLPSAAPGFTGRGPELAALDSALDAALGSTTPGVVVISARKPAPTPASAGPTWRSATRCGPAITCAAPWTATRTSARPRQPRSVRCSRWQASRPATPRQRAAADPDPYAAGRNTHTVGRELTPGPGRVPPPVGDHRRGHVLYLPRPQTRRPCSTTRAKSRPQRSIGTG
jgi:hypothetical protein